MQLKSFLSKTLFVGIISLFCDSLAQEKSRPNIVFIFSDDHAYQAISAYKGRLANLAPTPNIDRLAKDGMLFNKCYVTNSLCTPSRATVLTGTHSHINGVKILSDRLNPDQITFPSVLKGLGYQTAIIGKWHLKSDPVGFNYWDILPNQGEYYNPEFITHSGTKKTQGYVTDIITDKALHWLQHEREKNQPFMIMIHHKAPHRNFAKGPEHLTLFENTTFPEPENLFDDYENRGTPAKEQKMSIDKDLEISGDLKVFTKKSKAGGFYARFTQDQLSAWDAVYNPVKEEFLAINPQGKDLVSWKYQRYMRDYLATVRSVDDNVGRVLEYLDANGLTDNTLVVYCSDQGFYLGEHGWFDKRFMYEESFRTPLLMRWPAVIKKGTVNNEMVSNLDFAQTFIEIAGGQSPERMQGVSLLPLLKGKTPRDWRKSLYYHYYDFPAVHSVKKHEGVANKRYKLMHFYEINEWELYDLKKDPQEMKNQYNNPSYTSVIEEMKVELETLKKQYNAH